MKTARKTKGKTATKATSNAFSGGRYVTERVLGRGGMAAVYLARDGELDRLVAVKVLGEPFALDDEFARRFRREAQTAAKLAHSNVVQVFDTGEDDGRLFIVMEYVDGESLDRVLAREGRMAPDRALALGEQACAALAYAHEHGVVHRDVKPANLLLRRDGILKVADFGIARPEQATELTQAGTILGTLAYLAPEQARGEPATSRSDVYALGVVLYELLTGAPPQRAENLAQLARVADEPIPPLRELAPSVPPEAEAAIMRALARHPDERPSSAAELARELHAEGSTARTARAAASERATVLLRPAGGRLRRLGARGALAVAAVAAALVALVAFAAVRGVEDPAPARIEPVPASDDAVEQARDLEQWLRDHTRGQP